MSNLGGKIALVTGASAGIGLAVAQRLVDEGAFVFITGRRVEELEKAAAEIGHDVFAVQGDISEVADLDRLHDTIREQKGRLDIVVANAGISKAASIEDTTFTFGASAATSGPSVSGIRGPICWASLPARGEITSNRAVIGRLATPDCSGEYPTTCCSCRIIVLYYCIIFSIVCVYFRIYLKC